MDVYSADRSLKGKLRRRYAKLVRRRPVRVQLDKPMVTFAFDDPPKTATEAGAAILEERGLRGTFFVAAGLAGQDSPFGLYADDDDTRRLHAAGHEIACHTYSHLDCGKASGPAILADVERNAEALGALGVYPTTFAYPYGDVSPAAKAAIGGKFSLLRALHHGLVENGADLNQAPAVGIEGPDGETTAIHWLREAARKHAWLILFTHDVKKNPSPFGCTPEALERLADAALSMGFEVVTAAEGAKRIAA
jgi:peptidoglycan/xylan/chitin deacetylase (PgdA/CDA1 family)